MVIGLISDTHGLLRESALRALRGVEIILHAGDVGDAAILQALGKVAPVVAVRGNVDTAAWAEMLPGTAVADAGSEKIYMLHDVHQLAVKPLACGYSMVVAGIPTSRGRRNATAFYI